MDKIKDLQAASKTKSFWLSQILNVFSVIKMISTWFVFGFMASAAVSIVTFSLLSRDPVSIARPSYNAVIITIGVLLLTMIFAQAIRLSIYGMTHNGMLSPKVVGHRVNEILITVFMMYHVIKIQAPITNADIITNVHHLIGWFIVLIIAYFGVYVSYRMLPKDYKVALPEDMFMTKVISVRYSWVTHTIHDIGSRYQYQPNHPVFGHMILDTDESLGSAPDDSLIISTSDESLGAKTPDDTAITNDKHDDVVVENESKLVDDNLIADDEQQNSDDNHQTLDVERRSDVFKLPSRTKLQKKRHVKSGKTDKNTIPKYYSATIKEQD